MSEEEKSDLETLLLFYTYTIILHLHHYNEWSLYLSLL
jgi:hypothetical protein